MRKLIFILTFAGCILSTSEAQLQLSFTPSIFGNSLEGLTRLNVFNSLNRDLRAVITIRVRGGDGSDIVVIKTQLVSLRPGLNELNPVHFNNSRFTYFNNSVSSLLSQTRRLPAGEYEYCFEVDISVMKLDQYPEIYENCFHEEIQPQTPLLLVHPMDGDESCEKRPSFLWQPPVPISQSSRYQLVVAEIKAEQDATEAVSFNDAVINQSGILGSQFPFPTYAPELVTGKKYGWQVTVYEGKTITMKSEVWEFTVLCEEKKKELSDDGYRLLSDNDQGSFYFAYRDLKFSFNNPYNSGRLQYNITDATGKGVEIKKLPVLNLLPGLNKFQIDLDSNKGFKDGHEYLLTITLVDNRVLALRFIYRKKSIDD